MASEISSLQCCCSRISWIFASTYGSMKAQKAVFRVTTVTPPSLCFWGLLKYTALYHHIPAVKQDYWSCCCKLTLVAAQGLENFTPQMLIGVHPYTLTVLNITLNDNTVSNSDAECNAILLLLSWEQRSFQLTESKPSVNKYPHTLAHR